MLACLSLIPGAADTQNKTSYKYDGLGRLVEVKDEDVDTGIKARPTLYKYDDAGNRVRIASSEQGWRELLPARFAASSTDSRHGASSAVNTANGMADREIRAPSSVHLTQSHLAGEAWIRADLDSSLKVDMVDLIPANLSAWSVGAAQLNGASLQYSNDAVTWTTVGLVSGAAVTAYTSMATGGVEARYWRLWRETAGVIGVGDFRFFGGDAGTGQGAPAPPASPETLTFQVTAGQEAQFDPFEDTTGGAEPRALVSHTQGVRTTVWVEQDRPNIIRYRPEGAAAGTDSFTFKLRDANLVETTYTVNLTVLAAPVQPPGYPPWLYPDVVKANPGSTVTIYPLANDRDPDGDAFRLQGVTWPNSYGEAHTVDLNIGKVTYTPWFSFSGEVEIKYSAIDSRGAVSSNGVIKVIVQPDQPPVANPDAIVARPQIARTFDPRLNDTDADGDRLTITAVSQPQHGTAAISLGQAIVYTAAANYNGPDSFTYTINDGRGAAGNAAGSVSVTVQPNSDPVAVDDAVTLPGGGASTFDPRTNDTDVDGDALTVRSVGSPSRGVAAVVAGGGAISYTPTPGFTGVDSFTYQVADGHGGFASATTTITVDPLAVEYLVVGGGGGGGSAFGGGGGGAGALKTGTVRLVPGAHPITVGQGGIGGIYTGSTGSPGANGGASSIGTLVTAAGGGGGGGAASGLAGASGGGASSATGATGGAGVAGLGHAGGSGGGGEAPFWYSRGSGGGGGAASVGQSGVTGVSGAGGLGVTSSFAGVAQAYVAGGGGGGYREAETAAAPGPSGGPSAGNGGGSNVVDAQDVSANGGSGAANRGGGGGGGGVIGHESGGPDRGAGGAGGSGVVMLRYPGPPRPLGGTVTQIAGYTLHTFTADGSFAVTANRRPTAVNDAIGVRPGASRTFDPRVNDQDLDGDPLHIMSVSGATKGSVSVAAGGLAVIYTPNPGATSDGFIYTISDGQGGFATGTVAVTVRANTSPDAVNDNLTVSAGWPRTFDPLVNDTDPQGDALVIRAVSTPAHGQVQIGADGRSLTFTGTPGYTGPDSFTYTVDDGQEGADTATVNVTVQPSVRVFTISPAVGGKTTWNLDLDGPFNLGAAGTWTLTPLSNFLAQTKVWGAGGGGVGGGGGYTTGVIQFHAGEPYRLDVGSGGAAVVGGTPGGGTGGGAATYKGYGGGGFSGFRKSSGSAVIIGGAGGGAARGGAGGGGGGLSGENGADGTAGNTGGSGGSQTTGAPFVGGNGSSTYGGGGGGGYRGGGGGYYSGSGSGAGGGGGGSGYAHPAEVTGAVLTTGVGATPGNSADPDRNGAGAPAAPGRVLIPGAANANTAPQAADDTRTITFGGEAVLDPRANDYDPNGDILAVIAIGTPLHGTATRSGSVVTYKPVADYAGQDSFSYTVDDGRGGTAVATIAITIAQPTNTPPVAADDALSTRTNHALTFDPRANDSDVDLNALTVTAAGGAAHGALTVAANGASLTYTPGAGYAGVETLSYTISDNHGGAATATVAMTVIANTPPAAADDDVWSTDGQPFDPRTNDTDADSDTLTISAVGTASYGTVSKAADGQSVTYTRDADYAGPDSFTYTVVDGEGGQATATVRLNAHVEYLVVAGGGAGASNTASGLYSGKGGAGGLRQGVLSLPAGTTSLSVTVGTGGPAPPTTPQGGGGGADGGGSSIANLVTTTGGGGGGVYGSNGRPGGSGGGDGAATNATVGGAGTAGEGHAGGAGSAYAPGAGGGAGGPANGPAAGPGLVSSISGAPVTYAAGGGSNLATPGSGGQSGGSNIAGGGSAGSNGVVIIRYPTGAMMPLGGTVTQSGGYTIHTFTANAAFGQNRLPTVVGDSITARPSLAFTFNPAANDTDPDSDPLVIAAVGTPAHGAVTLAPDGATVAYTANAGYLGADSFTYRIRDNRGGFAVGAVSVTVVANTAPVAANDALTVGGATPTTFDPRTNDSDADGDALTVTAVGSPAHGTASVAAGGGGVVYAATSGYVGPDSFTYTVGDVLGVTATATVNVTVNASVSAVTWNPADRNANVALSNGNLTMSTSAVDVAVRATTSRSTGKYYYEATITTAAANSNVIGIATALASLADGAYIGSSAASYGYIRNGPVYTGGANVATYPSYTTGDVIGVAVDFTANKVWWSKNGTWNGNPAAGTGGVPISAGAYFPAASSGIGAVNTANFGATAFAYTRPSGFASWDGSSGAAPNQAPDAVNDNVQVERNLAKVLDPRVNDTDPDGNTLTIAQITVAPTHGTANVTVGGTSITYTPAADYTGPDSLTYQVSDGAGGTDTAVVTITVSATAAVTWNPADKNANVTLSNGNLTMAAGGVDNAVRATTSRSSGKYVFEATVTAVWNNANDIGIATGAASLADGQYVGATSSYGYARNGGVYNAGSMVATYPTYTTGDVIGVAVDLTANKVWFSKNGTWNGNPAAGTGGVTLTAGAYFPAASGGGNAAFTANFGATTFIYALPSGFSAWSN